MKILVVDDDRFIGDYIAKALRDAGHDAVYLQSALKALAAVVEQPFDLMLCDLVMPGINGIQTIRSIRNRLPNLPVIVLSSLERRRWEARCRLAGAAWYLQKPVSVEDLIAEVSLVEASRVTLKIGVIDFDPEHRVRLVGELGALGCFVRSWSSLPEMVRDYPHGPAELTLLLVDTESPDVITALGWAREYHVPAVAFGPPGAVQQEHMLRLGASLCVDKPVDGHGLLVQARFLVA